ncbi:large ribosomal subunit protein mL40 [Paramormyrops kingsleyae]|uniref:Large ribosomal subunit protein mL40 n=1 Tax=Paramormyrops kingsleyae TaxID=1676925 RepID=A0A3B3QVC2_9TELE|nr:39S ribosomal protein L40, mitochondrial [Paramormyrops kingsleyae]XP_023692873.1 39S ribosomal protein L40, mitochondrial [Paramormyrops kingsleyae]
MFVSVGTTLTRVLLHQSTTTCILTAQPANIRLNHWFPSLLAVKTSTPVRAEPTKKKKKVDPKRDVEARERLKKKLKRMEKVPPELIPIEDFIVPSKYLDEIRVRSPPQLLSEESERRALLLKDWARYKQAQHKEEMQAIAQALDAQQEALKELRLESEELYEAAIQRDPELVPFLNQGPSHTPPITNYQAPEGKYNDITKVYVQ